jgi:hypothetical protein
VQVRAQRGPDTCSGATAVLSPGGGKASQIVRERACPEAWIGVSSLQKGQSVERYVGHPLLVRGGTDGDFGGDFRIAASGSAASVLRLL